MEFYLGLDSALAYKGLKQGQVINRSRVEILVPIQKLVVDLHKYEIGELSMYHAGNLG